MSEALDDAERAFATKTGYALFGDLFSHGPREQTLPALLDIPQLKADLRAGSETADDLAAEHYAAMADAPPHASLFLDPERNLGGPTTQAILDLDTGYAPDSTLPADHVSSLCGTLAFLSAAEQDAVEDEAATQIDRVREVQAQVLDRFVLSWVVVWAYALRTRPLYGPASRLFAELAVTHRKSLSQPYLAPSLPPTELDLDEPKTSLTDIAEFLATPARSGILVTRTLMTEIGRSGRLPRGFGARPLELKNLMASAADHDALGSVLSRLSVHAEGLIAFYRDLGTPEPLMAPWRTRGEQTKRLLQHIASVERDER